MTATVRDDAGHEIGTHYNGHFCAGAEPSGKDWNTADWNSELDQFMTFLTDYKKINSWGDEVPDLAPYRFERFR